MADARGQTPVVGAVCAIWLCGWKTRVGGLTPYGVWWVWGVRPPMGERAVDARKLFVVHQGRERERGLAAGRKPLQAACPVSSSR